MPAATKAASDNDTMNKPTQIPFTLSDDQKFEALKMRYEDHVELLRFMTALDFQIFGGYITLQLLVGSWLGEHAPDTTVARVGIAIIDAALTLVAAALIHNNYMRRTEVVATLKNIATALCFNESGTYLTGRALNAPTAFRAWRHWYWLGIFVAFVGILLLLFVGFGQGAPVTPKP